MVVVVTWMADQERQNQAAPRPAPLPEREPKRMQVRPYPVFDRWNAHPGRGLTIKKIASLLDEAEEGYPEAQCDMFEDRIQSDAHLRSALEARVEAVALTDWIVIPGGDSDVDKEAASLLESALLKVENITETLEHQLRANWFGYSYSEIVWERRGPVVNGVPLAIPVWFYNVPHRRFLFDDFDRPRVVTQRSFEGEYLRPGKWWATTRPGRIKAASGLMRTAIWWSHLKTMGWRDWMVFANRFGLPFVYGQYDDEDEGIDDAEKKALKKAVQTLGTDGWAVFSKLCEIHIAEPNHGGGTGELHDRLISEANSEMSKLIEGTTLGIETPRSYGSYGASRETGSRTHRLRLGDAKRTSMSFASHIGQAFVQYNSIPAKAPRILFHVIRDDSPRGRAEVYDIARNKLGMRLDEDQVRTDLQLKAVTGAAIEPPAEAPAEGGTDDAADDETDRSA